MPEKVATPTFSLPGGEYGQTQRMNIMIYCSTNDATIRYSLDETEPNEASSVYDSPIEINACSTIKAKAFKDGWKESDIATATYIFKVPEPQMGVDSGVYTYPIIVQISCGVNGAKLSDTTIYYTLNGNEPTVDSTLYTGQLTLNKSTIVKAKAFRGGWKESETATKDYTITKRQIMAPNFYPPSGSYVSGTDIEIRTLDGMALIRVTLDGSEPKIGSSQLKILKLINDDLSIKAKAFKVDELDSDTVSAIYTVKKVKTPSFFPIGGMYNSPQLISIVCPEGRNIRYTTDGLPPSQGSNLYSTEILLNRSTTIMAQAYNNNFEISDIGKADYIIILPKVATPIIIPPSGSISIEQVITIQCSDNAASIRYTIDGNEPNSASTLYTSPIQLEKTATVIAKAFKKDYPDSDPASATYTIKPSKVATPTIYPPSGSISIEQVITIQCSDNAASIRYTIDGNEPNSASTLYTSPIQLEKTATVIAKAFKKDYPDSDPASATYTIKPSKVATPTIYPASGTYLKPVKVSIQCATKTASIHFTINGAEPTVLSPTYNAPFIVDFREEMVIVKAKAFQRSITTSGKSNTAVVRYVLKT